MSCAPGTTNCPLCSVNASLLPAWSVAPLFCRWPDFLGRNVFVPSLSGLSDFWRNWSWSSMPPASIPQCYMGRALEHVVPSVLHCVMALCTAKVGLLATAEKSYIYCCCFVKRRRFSYGFEVGHWLPTSCCCLMLMHFWGTNHQP